MLCSTIVDTTSRLAREHAIKASYRLGEITVLKNQLLVFSKEHQNDPTLLTGLEGRINSDDV